MKVALWTAQAESELEDIAYEPHENGITILRVVDGARDFGRLFRDT